MSKPVTAADREAAQTNPLFQRPTGLAVGLAQERLRAGEVGRLAPHYLGPPLASDRVSEAIRRFVQKCYQVTPRIDAPVARYTQVDSAQTLPRPRAGGARALARARRLPRIDRAAARARRASSSTRARPRPTARPARTTSCRASSRTSSRATRRCAATSSRARAAGTATACRSSSRSRRSSASHQGGHRALRRGRVQRQVPRVGAALHRRVERAHRAHRLLDRHRRGLLHARQRLRRVGLVVAQAGLRQGPAGRGPQGRPLLHRAAARRSPRTRWRSATATWSTRACSCASRCSTSPASRCSPGPRCPGRSSRTRRSRSTPRSPTCAPRLGDETLILAEALVERVLGDEARGREPLPGLRPARAALRAALPVHLRLRRARATPCWPATSSRSRTAPASSTPARPSARTTSGSPPTTASRSTTRCAPTAPSTTARARSPACTCATRTPPIVEALRESGRLFRAGEYEHAYPHCWRCDTPLIYYAKPNWYVRTTARQGRAARRQRDDQLAPRAHQARPLRQVAREQRRLGALARALLGHAAADLALRRRRRATWSASARSRRSAERGGTPPDDVHRPYVDEVVLHLRAVRRRDAPRARPDRRLVGLGLHAVRPVARAVRERGRVRAAASRPTTSARRSTRRAAGSTRCSPCRRCCSAAPRTRPASASA